MKPLFIFPVKECSTRLPRKNLLEINGKPLFSYPFTAMLEAAEKYPNSLSILTTESDDIIEKSKFFIKSYRNFAIDKRPEYLARDPYQMGDVCKFILDQKFIAGRDLSSFYPLIVIQCTAPLLKADDILACLELFNSPINDKIKSVRVFRRIGKIWENKYNSDTYIAAFYSGIVYIQSMGSIVICDPKYVQKTGKFPNYAFPYILPKERAIDVDDQTDFLFAKALMEADRCKCKCESLSTQ